jgi:outer membrane immunogenic protein
LVLELFYRTQIVSTERSKNTVLKNQLAAFTIATARTSFTALAQEDYTRFKSEASVQAFGSFVKQTTENGVDRGATDSAGVLATYRYYFSRHHGVEANYSWTSSTQTYTGFGMDTTSHEVSVAYVFRKPMKRWSPFVLAGIGALVFDPKNFAEVNTQSRAAFAYGAGTDINLTDHFFVRGECRGFVYDSPTFDLAGLNGLDRVKHRADPQSDSNVDSDGSTTRIASELLEEIRAGSPLACTVWQLYGRHS